MNLFFSDKIQGSLAFFSDEESQHIRHALRKKAGDAIAFTDGQGHRYTGRLVAEKKALYAIIEETLKTEAPEKMISLWMAPLKQPERMEWLVEKAVELGVSEMALLETAHTERHTVKYDRLKRLTIAAMKQSLQVWLPEIRPMEPFSEAIHSPFKGIKAIAWCGDTFPRKHLAEVIRPDQSLRLLIGPEGDFSEAEVAMAIDAGYVAVHLGSTRLRTETAALYGACLYKSALESCPETRPPETN
jgi:16S rRNA (uracil1498-N3)-methyltransferase